MNAGVEDALRQVAPERYDTYETLLRALSEGQVWMLLWHGQPGSPDAQYGNMELDSLGYAPCVTSTQELQASGWNRSHEVVQGRDIAAELYRERYGLWLNPHAPGGGVGVPWLDLRRMATGLDRLPAGPLRLAEPDGTAQAFYGPLGQYAHGTPVVRSLRGAWVTPALGEPYLAVGLDLYDNGPQAVEAVRLMMQQAVAGAPAGLAVSTVAMNDEFDQVALWMRHLARPFYDRELYGSTQPMPAPHAWGGAPTGYGAPQQPTAYGAPPQQGWSSRPY